MICAGELLVLLRAQCVSPEVKDIPWLFSEITKSLWQDQNTQEVPRNVDRQDYGQGQQRNHGHEQDDVALEGQVCHGINATFATDLLVPARKERRDTPRIHGHWDFPHIMISREILHIFLDMSVFPYMLNLDKWACSFYLIMSKNCGTTTLVSESVVTRSGRFRKPNVIK